MAVDNIKLNDVDIQYKDGVIYVDNYNTTLDSGVIVCEAIERLNINPLDELTITFGNNVRKYSVSDYTEEVASYNPKLYNYQIQYVSPTIKLERITLPNIAITKVFFETEKEQYLVQQGNYYCRSVGYYIRQYINEYYPYDDLQSGVGDKDIFIKADTIICPEMQFNRPTLKEVIQALYDVLDLTLVVEYDDYYGKYIYTYLDHNKINNPIEESKLQSDVVRNSVNTYATALDIELNDVISNNNKSSVQLLSLRSKDGVLTTDNASLILDYPIYEIKKLEVSLDFYTLNLNELMQNYTLGWLDLTNHVFEKSVFDTLPTGNVSDLDRQNSYYKNNSFYYSQGDNAIKGFGDLYRSFLGFQGIGWKYVVKQLLENLIYPTLSENIILQFVNYIEENLLNLIFRVTYVPITNVKMQLERSNKLNNSSILFDNTAYDLVNVETFAKYELDKINRISNNERTISAVYETLENVPELGDYIDDYILINRELSIYDNYVVFNGLLTKDYANRNQYSAIDSKKRFFNISTEKIIRNEIVKIYFILTYDYDETDFNNPTKIWSFEPNNKISHVILTHENNNRILKECSVATAGNSTLISFGYNDNISAGYVVGDNITGGKSIDVHKYVDEYGENKNVKFEFYTKPEDAVKEGNDYENISLRLANQLPKITQNDYERLNEYFGLTNKVLETTTTHHKDQREIQQWTLQLTFVSDENDIIIGDAFIKYNYFAGGIYDVWNNVKLVAKDKKFTKKDARNCEYDYILNENDYKLTINQNMFYIEFINKSNYNNFALLYNDETLLCLNNYSNNKQIKIKQSNDIRN